MGILTYISHVQVEGGGRDTSKGGGLTDRKQEAECWRKMVESCTDINISEKGWWVYEEHPGKEDGKRAQYPISLKKGSTGDGAKTG